MNINLPRRYNLLWNLHTSIMSVVACVLHILHRHSSLLFCIFLVTVYISFFSTYSRCSYFSLFRGDHSMSKYMGYKYIFYSILLSLSRQKCTIYMCNVYIVYGQHFFLFIMVCGLFSRFAVFFVSARQYVVYNKYIQTNLSLRVVWIMHFLPSLACVGVWNQLITAILYSAKHSSYMHTNTYTRVVKAKKTK